MQVVTPEFVSGKKVLLRYDMDVPLGKLTANSQQPLAVTEDFRLKAGLATLEMCLENASQVILLGHIGRPEGVVVDELSVAPIYDWLSERFEAELRSGKLKILENLRFEKGESFDSAQAFGSEAQARRDLRNENINYAKELASFGEVFVNEAFAAYRPAASTTILPTLLPHAAGIRFDEEVRKLTELRGNPEKPYLAIMGGAKVDDKLPVLKVLSGVANTVLVGGKLTSEIKNQNISLPENVLVGRLNMEGTDIAVETVEGWKSLILEAKTIVWNGPLGKFEDSGNDESAHDFTVGASSLDRTSSDYGKPTTLQSGFYRDKTRGIAKLVLQSKAKGVVGGGDTISALKQYGILSEFEKSNIFVSTGGGAMLEFIATGTLPTIEALN